MDEFQNDINDIETNLWYSSVSEGYLDTNETSELEEINASQELNTRGNFDTLTNISRNIYMFLDMV
ncbi:8570_t:CDS:2, partial [Dentiscutata erythropus]